MKSVEFSNNFPSNLLDKLIKNKNSFSSRRVWYIKIDVLQCTYDNHTNEILVLILFSWISNSYIFCSVREKKLGKKTQTVIFVIRNTRKLCWIESHRKCATTFHCRHKNNDYNNKGIKDISSKFTILCKSIYLSECFLGLLTIDSITTVTYSDWKSHK